MNTNGFVSSIEIKNAILSTPLTKKGEEYLGRVPLNKNADIDTFLNNCFVDADFISQDTIANSLNREDIISSLNMEEDYDLFASSEDAQKRYKYRVKRRSEKAQKDNFENDLLGLEGDVENRTYSTIFLIEGPAGCGKTTYAHNLLRNFIEVDKCDVETATQKSCGCFEKIYDFSVEELNPITAIEMLLLSQINKRLSKKDNETMESYKHRIDNICEMYNQYFISSKISIKDDKEFRCFFEKLLLFSKNKIDYRQLSDEIYSYFDEIIKESDHVIANSIHNDYINAIKFLLGIIMRVYFCLSKIDGNKYILFLDNIERFIISETGAPYIVIFDNDLQKILNSFYSIADETENIIHKSFKELSLIDSNVKYSTSFGILVTVRESTLSLLKSNHSFAEYFEQHHAESIPTYVNITNWFDFNKIFQKKIEFFVGVTNVENNKFSLAFSNILNDITISKWSLRRFLLSLFNDNYRRFFTNLMEAFQNYEDALDYYNHYWLIVKNSNDNRSKHIRHLCRKLIIRIVLDYMQNVRNPKPAQLGFFDCLMARCDKVPPSGDEVIKSSYARRILTYLDNINEETNGKAVSFPELAMAVLHRPIILNIKNSNVSLNDPKIKDIAGILSFASQTAKIFTNGVELVTINLNRKELHKGNLSNLLQEQWNKYRLHEIVNMNSFNIRITPAGSTFALIFPCFEYFACRYRSNSIPLFMLKTEKERENLLFGENEDCKGIIDMAMNCINSVIKFETRFLSMDLTKNIPPLQKTYAYPKWLFNYNGTGTGMVHALRIIFEHLGYLHDYRDFLAFVADDSYENEHYKNDDKDGIVDKAIKKYTNKFDEIYSKYPRYLEIGNIPNVKK